MRLARTIWRRSLCPCLPFITIPAPALSFRMASTVTVKRTQPPWGKPTPQSQEQEPRISIYNSLTRSKNPFVTLDPQGRKIKWYICGPTVYDNPHTGQLVSKSLKFTREAIFADSNKLLATMSPQIYYEESSQTTSSMTCSL